MLGLRAPLHRDDIDELKVVYLCSKHFREDEVETTHKVPNGDGSYREKPRNRPKLKDGAVPTILPGCPRCYSHHTATKRTRLSLEDKDDELLYQAVKLSLESDIEENEKFKIHSFHDLQAKLPLLSIASIWSVACQNCYRGRIATSIMGTMDIHMRWQNCYPPF